MVETSPAIESPEDTDSIDWIELLWSKWGTRLHGSARWQAGKLQRQHADYVDAEDAEQECLVWLFDNAKRVHGWMEDNEAVGLAKAGTAMWRAGHAFCMKQRYLKDGTGVEDYYKYTPLVLIELLPDALDPLFDGTPGQSSTDYDSPKGKTDPSKGNGYLAAIVDVRGAFPKLSDDDRVVLVARFMRGSGSLAEVAESFGITDKAAGMRVKRALERLAALLGLHEQSDWVGRKAESNAASLARMERQYG